VTRTAVLRRLAAVSAPPRARLLAAAALGLAGAAATVGLLAGSGYVVDRAAFRPGLAAIAGVLALVEVLAFIRAPLRYAERLVAHDAAFRALSGWRVWLFDRLEPLAPAGFAGWRSGDLLTRAVEDVDTLQDLYLRGVVPVAVAVGAGALAVAVVGLLVPWAALVLGLALVTALVGGPVLMLAGRHGSAEAAARAALAAETVDLLQGAAELLAFGADQEALDRREETSAFLARQARARARATGAATALQVLCTGGAMVGVLALGVAALHRGQLEPVMTAVLPLTALAAFETVPVVTASAGRLPDLVAAGRRLLEVADRPAPVTDPEHPDPLPVPGPGGGLAVSLEGVALRYAPGLPRALDGVDLQAAAGSRTALTGSSGAGKTSVVNLLLRFWPPETGRVTLGSADLARLAQHQARTLVALADQYARLFSGTLRDNLLLGRPDAGPAEVDQALARAGLAGFVAGLPEGLDTPVGEGGARLSGGERRRLAVARALLSPAPVLLLDEPTAGLDRDAARHLLGSVLGPGGGERTVLVVTHDTAECGPLDQTVTLEEGRVRPG
jgi:thiol reductant ABC exporter CydC subunit